MTNIQANHHSLLRDSGAYHMMNATSTSRKNVFRGNSDSMIKAAGETIPRNSKEDLRTHTLVGQGGTN